MYQLVDNFVEIVENLKACGHVFFINNYLFN